MKQLVRAVIALSLLSALSGAAHGQEILSEEILAEDILPDEPRGRTEAIEVSDILPAPEPAPIASDTSDTAPARRYFLLLFDSPLGSLSQMDEVDAEVDKWISGGLLPTDAVAVVSYYGQELQIAQDFTRDHEALRGAVTDAIRGRVHEGAPAAADGPSLVRRLAGADLKARTASFYGVLQVLAGAVDSVPGPKGLLVFSKGFGRARPMEVVEPVAGAGGFSGSSMLAGPEISEEIVTASPILEKYLPARHLYEPTLEALVSRQIQLYPIDLATDYRETYPLAGVMSRLAAETDGRYVYPVAGLPGLLQELAQNAEPAAGDRLVEGAARPATAVGLQE